MSRNSGFSVATGSKMAVAPDVRTTLQTDRLVDENRWLQKEQKGQREQNSGKFHIPDNDWSHEPAPKRKMRERKIRVESGIYLPFSHFPFQ
jgi:hypothetical protein